MDAHEHPTATATATATASSSSSSSTSTSTSTSTSLESLGTRVGLALGDAGAQEDAAGAGAGAAGAAAQQVPLLVRADWVRQGRLPPSGSEGADAAYEACLQGEPWAGSLESWCKVPHHHSQIQHKVTEGGWSEAEAAVLNVCSDYLAVLTESVRQCRPDYAALLHQHQRILCRRALLQGAAGIGYKHLIGKKGLVHRDPQWSAVADGAASFTAHGSTNVWSSTAVLLSPQGLRVRGVPLPSPVVQFVSRERDDAAGAVGEIRTAVDTGGGGLTFPPLTKFTVVRRNEPGWLHDTTQAVVETCQQLFGGEAPTPSAAEGGGGGDGGGRLSIGRDALWSWLEGRAATAAVVDGGDSTTAVGPRRFDRRDATHQAWLSDTLLPEGAASTIFAVGVELIVVHAAWTQSATRAK